MLNGSFLFKMSSIKSSSLIIGQAYLAFISLGLPDGLLGVAWPSIRAYFDLPLDALGTLLVMLTTGYLLSSFNCGRILAHMNVGAVLALSCLATALSLVGCALAPGWGVIITLGLLAGMGAGAIDTGLNTYAATHFSARSVNWLHACYGIGATLGPLLMTGVLGTGHRWQTGYALVGIGQLVLALCFGATHKLWLNHTQEAGLVQNDALNSQSSYSVSPASPTPANTLRLPAVWLSIAVFFIYTGIEASAGAWSYSLFTEGRAIPITARESTHGQCRRFSNGRSGVGNILVAGVDRCAREKLWPGNHCSGLAHCCHIVAGIVRTAEGDKRKDCATQDPWSRMNEGVSESP